MSGPFISNLFGGDTATKMGLVHRVSGVETFEDVFGDIGLLDCDPVKIELQPDARPYSIASPRRIPFPILPQVEEELKRMQSLGIIEEVKEAPDWCVPMVPVMKKNKKPRICVDLTKLNKDVKRERCPHWRTSHQNSQVQRSSPLLMPQVDFGRYHLMPAPGGSRLSLHQWVGSFSGGFPLALHQPRKYSSKG